MSYRHVHIGDCQQLQLHIYVVGYQPMGESILVVLWDDEAKDTLKTILIDCFELDGKNELENVFKQYNIDKKKFNVIIWTHPDLDHSVGFSRIVDNYTCADTLFILPEGFSPFYKSFLHKSMIKSWLAVAKNRWLKRKLNVERVNASNLREFPMSYQPTYYEDGLGDGIKFSIEMLTPFAGQVFKHLDHNSTHKGNHISISLLVRLGEISFYFGGDTENEAINMVDINKLHNVVFVKIPHHGSPSSLSLPVTLEKLKEQNLIPEITSVSSGYHRKNEDYPDEDVLTLYKDISSNVLLTERGNSIDKYGIVYCPFNINPYIVKPYALSGAAMKWYGKL